MCKAQAEEGVPFPDFITSARRELIPSEDFLDFLVGAISALVRMSRDSGLVVE